jgi:hypothetical protein
LVSHFSEFSVIFYTIYNFQQTALTVGVTFLQLGPWKDLNVRNVVPMAAAGAGLPIPARPTRLLPGEGVEEDLGGTRARFGHWFGREVRPAVVLGGTPRRRPLLPLLRRGPGR